MQTLVTNHIHSLRLGLRSCQTSGIGSLLKFFARTPPFDPIVECLPQWRRQPRRNGGRRGTGVWGTEKFWDHALFYATKRPFYRQGTPMFKAGGTLFKCNSTLRSSETVRILGFLMTNIANKAMSTRNGSNETLVSNSHSDMSH